VHQESDPEQLRLISRNRSQIFVLDNNDNVFLFGAAYGMDLNGGTLTSGAARNEMSGSTLTFTGREAAPYYLIEATAGVGTHALESDHYDGLILVALCVKGRGRRLVALSYIPL
jgi:hypothetical protein